jgi:hypothetical protein
MFALEAIEGRWDMRNSKLSLLLIALVGTALLVPALSTAGSKTVEVDAKLQGKNEVPGPGDKNGKGEAQIFLKAKKHKVCFNLEVSRLDTVTMAHIHKGAPDVAGKIKVVLFENEVAGDGTYEGCVKDVKKKLVRKIGKVPEKFYVNVHTQDFPDGAIRGQLEPAA